MSGIPLTVAAYQQVSIDFTISGGLVNTTWAAPGQTLSPGHPLILQQPAGGGAPGLPEPAPGQPWWSTAVLTSYLSGWGDNDALPIAYLDCYAIAPTDGTGSATALSFPTADSWVDSSGVNHAVYGQTAYHGPAFARQLLVWIHGYTIEVSAYGRITLLLGHEPVGITLHSGGS